MSCMWSHGDRYVTRMLRRVTAGRRWAVSAAGMTAGRRWAVSAAAIAVALGVFAGARVATSSAADSNANRAAARTEATRLLSLVAVPPGTTSVPGEPAGDGGWLADPGVNFGAANLVDAWGWWTTTLTPADVLAYFGKHLPADARLFESFHGSTGAAGQAFSLGPIPGVLRDRIIAMTVVPLSGGGTGVRTDGEAVWLTARPAWERIPAGVRRISFTASGQTASGKPGRASSPRTVTGAAARRLVSLINGLEVVQPGVTSCPQGVNEVVRLTFRSASGAKLASAEEHPSGCAHVSLTVGGRSGPLLIDDPSVTSELIRVGAIPVCTGAQLGAVAGVPTFDPSGRIVAFTFTNRSNSVCRLDGAPLVRLFDARGRQVPATAHRISGGGTVSLDPGQAASISLAWARCGGAARVTRVRLTLPGVASPFTLAVGSRRMPFAPCHGRISVSPPRPTF